MIVKLDRKYYSYNFACWLRRNMRMEMLNSIRSYSTYYMDKYLEEQFLNKKINVRNIVFRCSNSLYIDVYKDYITISISGFEKYEDIPLAALANMITFGALGFCIEYATKTKRRFKYATIFCLVADVAGIVTLIILSL